MEHYFIIESSWLATGATAASARPEGERPEAARGSVADRVGGQRSALLLCSRGAGPSESLKLGDPRFTQANLFGSTKVLMATPQGLPHTRASLEPETSGFSTLHINHYATRGGGGYYYEDRIGTVGPVRPRAFDRKRALRAASRRRAPRTE